MSDSEKLEMNNLQSRIQQLEQERDNALHRAERAEKFADTLFESPVIGHGVVKQGKFSRVNARMCSLMGYDSAQLLTMGPMDVTPQDGLEELKHNFARLQLGTVPYFIMRKKLTRRDGTEFWDDAYVQRIESPNGEFEGMLGSFVDMSEAHNLQDDLDAREALFHAVTKQSSEGISVIDETGSRVLVNQAFCEMLGFTESELLAGRMQDNLAEPSTAQDILSKRVDHARFEVLFKRKDGSTFAAEVSTSKIEVGGRELGLAYIHDITERLSREQERLALEAQIQQAQKLESLGVLAGGIAHDFNNLLVGILGNAELALHGMPPEATARDSVQDIATAAERAADLVRQMLAYAGKGRFIVEHLQLNRIVEEMTHLLEVSISKKAVIRYEFGHRLPLIKADATQVRQIVMNLITNASDAIGERTGVISICTGAMDCDKDYLSETYLDDDLPEGQYVYVEVSDTGVGLDPSMRARIFDPFYTTKFTGRGLGLAAVLGIVRGHHGAIKLYSEVGKGTTFKVLFPACDSHITQGEEAEAAETQGSFSGTVLLVDDEETVRSVGKRMLERIGFEVETAVDGRDALQVFKNNPGKFSVVLLDLTMPHMDGEACFRELRRVNSQVRVVLTSGYNQQELTTRFAGKGLAGFIQKPYRMKTLREALSKVLTSAETVEAE